MHFTLKIGFGICVACVGARCITNIDTSLYFDSVVSAVDLRA